MPGNNELPGQKKPDSPKPGYRCRKHLHHCTDLPGQELVVAIAKQLATHFLA
jgi:hypothetical protein